MTLPLLLPVFLFLWSSPASSASTAPSSPCPYVYTFHPRRSLTQKRSFEIATGYPHGRRGYVVDHIVPLCAGGRDAPSNMQWQELASSYKKDAWEKSLCTELRRAAAQGRLPTHCPAWTGR